MDGYSRTPLAKKLGIKDDFRVYVINTPDNYLDLIAPLPQNVTVTDRIFSEIDMVHFFTKSKHELASEIPKQLGKIKENGMIWVSWPKKSSKVPTDITEDVVREVILPLGLVDIKVCAIDEI